MAATMFTYFLTDATAIEAREVRGNPGALAASIRTGDAEITLHGDHAQLFRLAAALTEQLAKLAPELGAVADGWKPVAPDPGYGCTEYGDEDPCQVTPTWFNSDRTSRMACDRHAPKAGAA